MKKNGSEKKVSSDMEAIVKSNYRNKLLSKEEWVNRGEDLLEAASLLEPMVREFWKKWKETFRDSTLMKQKYKYIKYLGIYFMLISYAIENFLKAAVIGRKRKEYNKYLEHRSELPGDLKTHNLVSLSRRLGMTIDLEREELLRRLTRSAEWYGRYPVPLRHNSLGPEKFGDNKEYLTSHFAEEDINRIKNLISNIKNFLEDGD